MSIAVIMPNRDCDPVVAELRRLMPEHTIQCWPDIDDPENVSFAVLWKHAPGTLGRLPNLRGVMSYGAGADFILDDPELPSNLPVGRTVTPGLVREMCEFVVARVLSERKGFPALAADQAREHWNPRSPLLGRRVAMLGMGALGLPCALALRNLGYEVDGVSRTAPSRDWPGEWVAMNRLKERLSDYDFVVCLLPLTPGTRGLLNQSLFEHMKTGSCLINASRGEVLDQEDLLAALDRDQPGSACLDVFAREPLPRGHCFWRHPKIRVTPHCAALTDPAEAAKLIARSYHCVMNGEALPVPVRT